MKGFLKFFLAAAVIGISIFLFLVARVTTVEQLSSAATNQRFVEALAQFEDTDPMLSMDATGSVMRRTRSSTAMIPQKPTHMTVLAWRGGTIGLVEVEIPLWFLRMKGPAIRYVLRDTDFDIEKWGLTVEELEDFGAGVVVHIKSRPGERLLVWID